MTGPFVILVGGGRFELPTNGLKVRNSPHLPSFTKFIPDPKTLLSLGSGHILRLIVIAVV